jgi:hypothetical protein
MTADLKEAVAMAAVAFIEWESKNEKVRDWGWYYISDDHRYSYFPEPKICFFGREVTISSLVLQAAVLSGPLTPLVQTIFELLDETGDYASDWGGINTYPQAIEILKSRVELEYEAQEDHPIGQPSTADLIRRIERDRMFQFFEQSTLEHLDSRRGLANLFRLKPRNWRLIMKALLRSAA